MARHSSHQSPARLTSLIASLRLRYAEADHRGDAQAKQALFQHSKAITFIKFIFNRTIFIFRKYLIIIKKFTILF